jgi:hypothetical protein
MSRSGLMQGLYLIQSQNGSGAAGALSFTSIPQIYKDLILEVVGRSIINASQQVRLTLNNDTTAASYDGENTYGAAATPVSAEQIGSVGYITLGWMAGNDAAANLLSSFEATIYEYTNTNIMKNVYAKVGGQASLAGGGMLVGHAGGVYESTSAITRVDVVPSGASAGWTTSTIARLWGRV